MKSEPVYLWSLPMFHCNGWTFAWGAAARGGTNVCILLTGGAPPPAALLEKIENLGFHVTHGVSVLSLAEVDVKDLETMASVPRDGKSVGEIVLQGSSIMKGYFKDEEATRKAFKNGWFLTGDVGVIHPDGYFEIKDRSKDVIISGGENISSVEVESILYRHPDVLEAAVKSLPHFTAPKKVAFLEELPKTATGKIQKFELRSLAKTYSPPPPTSASTPPQVKSTIDQQTTTGRRYVPNDHDHQNPQREQVLTNKSRL
ncbi:hypothetical protein MKX01_037686 [Papaver californicum]|nr:hypothetical protein MKX01_037686 [Papaver californicum]